MIRAFFIAVALAILTGAYALLIEPRHVKLRFETVGSGPETLRLVLISDLHMGGFHTSASRVQRWVETINAQQADYVLMPGDFINGSTPHSETSDETARDIQAGFDSLSQLTAPSIATIGNHDVWHSRHFVKGALERAGVIVLTNKSWRQDEFCFVGLDDHDTGQPDRAAYKGCDDTDMIITLMHSPDTRHLIHTRSAVSVAGHTHGGQVNLPGLGRRVTATQCGEPRAYGWVQSNPPLFVTSGVGTSILPIRFRSQPEIVVISLNYTNQG